MTTSLISLSSMAHRTLTRVRSALGISTFRRTVSSLPPFTNLSRSATDGASGVFFALGRAPQLLVVCFDIQLLLADLMALLKGGDNLGRPGTDFGGGGA